VVDLFPITRCPDHPDFSNPALLRKGTKPERPACLTPASSQASNSLEPTRRPRGEDEAIPGSIPAAKLRRCIEPKKKETGPGPTNPKDPWVGINKLDAAQSKMSGQAPQEETVAVSSATKIRLNTQSRVKTRRETATP